MMHKKLAILFTRLLLAGVFLLPGGCAPAAVPQMPTPTVTAALTATVRSSATPSPVPPTATDVKTTTQEVPEKLLDWQVLRWPNLKFFGQMAFDGQWLVTLNLRVEQETVLYARRVEDGPDALPIPILEIPPDLWPLQLEGGSGLEAAGGRVAVLLAPRGGDDPAGFHVVLIDLETGEQRVIRKSESRILSAFPAVALSEDWLAIKDLDGDGRSCITVYHLPEVEQRYEFCAASAQPQARLQWPALGGNTLAYIEYDPSQACPLVQRVDLASGETKTLQPKSCTLGLAIAASDDVVAWKEVQGEQIFLRGVAGGQSFDLPVTVSGWPLHGCGSRVYYQTEREGAAELRAWEPGMEPVILHRYRPDAPATVGRYTDDASIPQYGVDDLRCGGGWLVLLNHRGEFLVAREP